MRGKSHARFLKGKAGETPQTYLDKNNIIMNASVVNSIREYFKTKPVEKAWVFGSFSRNEEREDSDIDIMVELSRQKILIMYALIKKLVNLKITMEIQAFILKN